MAPLQTGERRGGSRHLVASTKESQRIELSLSHISHTPIQWPLIDRSAGGLSFQSTLDRSYFLPGTPLDAVRIVEGDAVETRSGVVRHVSTIAGQAHQLKVGVELNPRSPGATQSVSFELTKEQKALQDAVKEFAHNEIVPVAAYHDRTGEFPWAVLHKAFDLGIFGCHIPKEYGGGGLGLFETALISEELGAACTAMMTSIMVNVLATGPLLLAGTPAQKEKYLTQCSRQLTLFSFCFTEPDAGSDPSRMATTAELRGDEYILNGSKCFITNSGVADYLVVFATVDKTLKTAGITVFIVPSKAEGVRIGKTLDKMGQRASNTAEIAFENVRVPIEERIGEEGKGFKIGLLSLARSRVNVAAGGAGLARTALELALKRVNTRVQFNKPLSSFQYVQFRLSDIARDIEAGRLLAWKAAFLHDQGRLFAKESSMAKDFCADLAMRASSEALDLFGGYGYSRDFPMEKMMRDAKLLQIYEGPTPVHKMIVYRELAREHGFEALA